MTAKERLRQLINDMSELDAYRLLLKLEPNPSNGVTYEVVRPKNRSEREPTDFDALFAFSDEVARNAPEEDVKGTNLDTNAEQEKGTSVFAFLRQVAENAPEEDARRVPTDLAENLDHYIDGTPKRTSQS